MARKSAPQVTVSPRFLSQLVKGSKPYEVLVDANDSGKHLSVTADGIVMRDGRGGVLKKVKGSATVSGVNEGGFDTLFGQHVSIFKPSRGEPEDIYQVFKAWAFCQIARDFLPVRPIALFTGPPGSTKSTTAQAVAQLWFGSEASTAKPTRLPENARDFTGLAVSNPLVIVDNVEAAERWLADTLCIIASGDAKIATRQLYTTAGVLEATPDTFLVVTSYSAKGFTRGDLLSRSLLFELQAPNVGYQSRAKWTEQVERCRTGFWFEAMSVLKVILKTVQSDQILSGGAYDRLQDFAWMGQAICEHFGGSVARQRFLRGMAGMYLSKFYLGAADSDIEPLVAIAMRTDTAGKWFTSTDLLAACSEAVDRPMTATRNSVEQFGRWMSTVHAKAPGTLLIGRRFLHGRTLWNVTLPSGIQAPAALLDAPIVGLDLAVGNVGFADASSDATADAPNAVGAGAAADAATPLEDVGAGTTSTDTNIPDPNAGIDLDDLPDLKPEIDPEDDSGTDL